MSQLRNHIKLTFLLLFTVIFNNFSQTSDLIISEYSEGSSNNKYVEIFNGTGASVDLSNYQMISGLKSVDDCRAMIQSIARTYNDGSRTTGAYECAIEIVDSIQGENVYRTTTR